MTETQKRRTKRRYAHELYPFGPDNGETRPLEVEVPVYIARALGLTIDGTSWMEVEPRTVAGDRIGQFLLFSRIAFLADALLQDKVGQEAWDWADLRSNEEADEWLYERAVDYGIDPMLIKPYPCGPEPKHHDHYSHGTHGIVTRIPIPESECADCTEPVTDGAPA
jgi:hypothetical protein